MGELTFCLSIHNQHVWIIASFTWTHLLFGLSGICVATRFPLILCCCVHSHIKPRSPGMVEACRTVHFLVQNQRRLPYYLKLVRNYAFSFQSFGWSVLLGFIINLFAQYIEWVAILNRCRRKSIRSFNRLFIHTVLRFSAVKVPCFILLYDLYFFSYCFHNFIVFPLRQYPYFAQWPFLFLSQLLLTFFAILFMQRIVI